MTPYLIQRAKFENRDYKNGIDSILSFDYMGSSEFEFGALPKSLTRIRENIISYVYFDFVINQKVITVLCKESVKQEIDDYLINLSRRIYRLKEFSAFDDYIKGDGYFKDKFDLWWDIENDLMFWKKDDTFEIKFKKEIQP